jgi:hypothetical protein
MGQTGNSGEKKSSKKISWINLDNDEKKDINSYYNNFINENKEFLYDKFIFETFLNLSDYNLKDNLTSFLNSYYNEKKYTNLIPDNKCSKFDILALSNI